MKKYLAQGRTAETGATSWKSLASSPEISMPILKHDGRLILFVHIPKTGGTSVEAYMRQKGPLSFYNNSRLDGMSATPQHLHQAMLERLFCQDFFDGKFTILRDPLDRLISEFRWRARVPDPKYARFGLRDLSRRGKFLIHGKKRFFDFDEWVTFVFERYERDPFFYDNHLRPQHEFLNGDETLFLLEDGLAPVYRWLDDATGTSPSPEPDHHKKNDFPYPSVSAETRDKVHAFYQQDFALLRCLTSAPVGQI